MPDIKQRHERGIVAVACQLDGLTYSMPAPARHQDVLEAMYCAGVEAGFEDQGFLDHRGVFLGRKAAMIVAYRWGQVIDEFEDDAKLYSEYLW